MGNPTREEQARDAQARDAAQRHFVVTFEWHNTAYVRRVCEGTTVEEAIQDGFANMDDCSDQQEYDQPGDTFVGAIIEYPDAEKAAEAQQIGYATALQSLPIPFEHDEDCNKLRIVTEERDALRVLLATARADLEKMTTHADAFVQDWAEDAKTAGDPTEEADFERASLAVENARHTIEAIDHLVKDSGALALIDRAQLATLLDAAREWMDEHKDDSNDGTVEALDEAAEAGAAAERALGLAPGQDTRTTEA